MAAGAKGEKELGLLPRPSVIFSLDRAKTELWTLTFTGFSQPVLRLPGMQYKYIPYINHPVPLFFPHIFMATDLVSSY